MGGGVQWRDVGVWQYQEKHQDVHVRFDNGGKEVGDAGRCQGTRHGTLKDAKEWKDMADLLFFPLSMVCR